MTKKKKEKKRQHPSNLIINPQVFDFSSCEPTSYWFFACMVQIKIQNNNYHHLA